MNTYSQLGQDTNVIKFYNYRKNLYFLDVGAFDGVALSNTYLLETEYGWNGICVEPLEVEYNKLKSVRKAICVNKAIYNKSDMLIEFSKSDMLSGITEHIDCHMIAKNGETVKVKTITMNELLENCNAPNFIHYLSIDTEGSELEILKYIDYDKFMFGYINVEHNYVEPRRTDIRKLLTNNGYIYKGENAFDDDYIHNSLLFGIYYFNNNYDKPINILLLPDGKVQVSSPYWHTEIGNFDGAALTFTFPSHGKGYINADYIKFEGRCNWHRDYRNNYINNYINNFFLNYRDHMYDSKFSNYFINNSVDNKKGESFDDRFIDIMSDPSNLLIKRDADAGTLIDNHIVMHNGIRMMYEYYGDFSKILMLNKGCHEPGEERIFNEVLKHIPDNGTMIELGSYWCFYTIWFNKCIVNAKNYCIESEIRNLDLGKYNCQLNNIVNVDFTHGFIGNNNIKITEFIKIKNIKHIDILHSDIQGYEFDMINDIVPLLDLIFIKYLFISTHSNNVHNHCVKILKKHNYRIISNCDLDETFCCDGIIVACHKDNLEIPEIYLGNRRRTKLRKVTWV